MLSINCTKSPICFFVLLFFFLSYGILIVLYKSVAIIIFIRLRYRTLCCALGLGITSISVSYSCHFFVISKNICLILTISCAVYDHTHVYWGSLRSSFLCIPCPTSKYIITTCFISSLLSHSMYCVYYVSPFVLTIKCHYCTCRCSCTFIYE